jgi:hypothetical protein
VNAVGNARVQRLYAHACTVGDSALVVACSMVLSGGTSKVAHQYVAAALELFELETAVKAQALTDLLKARIAEVQN